MAQPYHNLDRLSYCGQHIAHPCLKLSQELGLRVDSFTVRYCRTKSQLLLVLALWEEHMSGGYRDSSGLVTIVTGIVIAFELMTCEN